VVLIATERKRSSYTVAPITTDFGYAAYRVSENDSAALDHYDVLLAGEMSTCDCLGLLRHGHCKHVDCLTALRNAGRI
jgi:hypothetical protein